MIRHSHFLEIQIALFMTPFPVSPKGEMINKLFLSFPLGGMLGRG
jgi:hypothetical protein